MAHSSILVYDPAEQWLGATSYSAGVRAGTVTGNDGGQHHSFPNHNGAVADVPAWMANSAVYNIADILAFEDQGNYLYVAGDCSRAYSSAKVEFFTRQIVYLRPGTFVIFDRVKSKNAGFKKTWVLQAMKPPVGTAPNLVITNGAGRLFLQTLLPQNPQVSFASGDSLYRYDNQNFPPSLNTGPAPECRISVSPATAAATDYFLHVLTATDTVTKSVSPGVAQSSLSEITVTVDTFSIAFTTAAVGGHITIRGQDRPLTDTIVSSIKKTHTARSFSIGLQLSIAGPSGPVKDNIKISFTLPAASLVNLKIYNISGQEMATLVNERRTADLYEENLSTRNLSAGIYFCRLETEFGSLVRRMVVWQ
jgi:hypothetical protein